MPSSKPRGEIMRRREFIAGIGSAAMVWPLAARAQQEPIARIGYLAPQSASFGKTRSDAFRAGLRDLGYVEGKNFIIEYRYSGEDESKLPELAAELVALKVDVIVTLATATLAAARATTIIPIVQAVGQDLVALRLAASIRHPGGNVTGSTFFVSELMAKRLELLKEILPSIGQAGVLLLRNNPTNDIVLATMATTAKVTGVELVPTEVRGPAELESTFSAWAHQQIGGLVIIDHAQFQANAVAIAALAIKHHLPAIGSIELGVRGGLIGYGVSFPDLFGRAATFVDKILRGMKPGDLPIEQASKFKFVLNQKTAKALALDVPTAILLRGDEVIE